MQHPSDRLLLGTGLGDTTFSLVNPRSLEPAPDKGELLISGSQLGQGYLRRPGMSKVCFVTVGGERCFRTGDYFIQVVLTVLRYYFIQVALC